MTRLQGPGSCQDVLDAHFGFWNWLKYVGHGETLLQHYKNAVGDRNLQNKAHHRLTEVLEKLQVEKWEKMCQEWDAQIYLKTKPNLYEAEAASKSHTPIVT